MKLLIVDDSARFRALVRSLLESLSPEIEECADGDEAVYLYAQSRPDITLMDIRMKRVSGLTATRRIKEQHQYAKIIIISALDDDNVREAAREAGASAYILKDELEGLAQLVLSMSSDST